MTTTETLSKVKTRRRLDIQFLTMKLMTGLPRFACIPWNEYDSEQAAMAVMTDEGRIMLGGQSWDGVPADEHLLNMHKLGGDLVSMLAGVVDQINRSQWGRGVRQLRTPNWNRIESTLADIRTFREKYEGGPDKFDADIQAASRTSYYHVRTLTFYTAFPSSRMPTHIREEVNAKHDGQRRYGPVHIAWEATWAEALRLTVGAERRQMDAPLDPIAFAQDLDDGKYYILGTWDLTKLESYIVDEFTEAA
jgi:hypothetical protein